MPKVTRKQMAEEAAKRMKILKMKPSVIEAFLNNNQIPVSDDYELDLANSQFFNFVIHRYNVFVYYVLFDRNPERKVRQTFLYVSPTPDLWEEERNALKKGFAIAQENTFSKFMDSAITKLVQVKPGRNGRVVRKDRCISKKFGKRN